MKKIILFVGCIALFGGCASSSVCPRYPKPSQHTLSLIKSLNDRETDLWMIEQYKLNQKLNLTKD